MMRFEEDELEYAGAFNTSPNYCFIDSVHCDKSRIQLRSATNEQSLKNT